MSQDFRKIDTRGWAETANKLAKSIGEEAAYKLITAFGGRSLHITKTPSKKTIDLLGKEVAVKLHSSFPTQTLYIPNLRAAKGRKAQMFQLRAEGKSTNEIAAELGVTARYVRLILNVGRIPPVPLRDRIRNETGTPEEIAARLGCTVKTVVTHQRALFGKSAWGMK